MLNSESLIKISAGLILVSTIGFSGKAHAETATVPFGGQVVNKCTFGTPTAGILAKSDPSAAMEGSGGLTGFDIGTAGTVTVDCDGGGNLTVAPPVAVSAPASFTQTVLQSTVQRGTSTDFTSTNTGGPFATPAWTGKSTAPLAIPDGVSALNVAMVVGRQTAGSVPSGNYNYSVTLTVTPN